MANSIWIKKVLLPFWTLQLLLTIGLIALYTLACVLNPPNHESAASPETEPTEPSPYESSSENNGSFFFVSSIVFAVLDVLVCATLIFQIVEYSLDQLSAPVMFVSQLVLSLYWTLCLLLTILGDVGVIDGPGSLGARGSALIWLFLIIDT